MIRTSARRVTVLADALVFALLEQAQELGLDFQRQVADLVEEERAAVRGAHLAPVVA